MTPSNCLADQVSKNDVSYAPADMVKFFDGGLKPA